MTKPVLIVAAMTVALLQGGCGGDAVPDAYLPASAAGCPDLVGDYALGDPSQARLLINQNGPPAVRDWSIASIERASSGRQRLVLRRSPGTVLIEAMELRGRSPDEYRVWRERTLVALGAPAPAVAARFGAAGAPIAGPHFSFEYELPESKGCEDGWMALGGSRELAPPIADGSAQAIEYGTVAMSRGRDRALLVRMRVSRANPTGWVFFGQPIVYHTHGYDRWYRFAALPTGTEVRLDPAKLAPVHSEEQRAEVEREARELALEADTWLRSRLASDVRVSVLRRTQFDPTAMRLGPGAVRLEIAGTFDRDLDPDPFQRVLRGSSRTRDIELERRERRDADRDYALVRFTWRAMPTARH